MNRIKYFVAYHGLFEGGFWDDEYADGVTSLYEAMKTFRYRNRCNIDYVSRYRLNLDDIYVPWSIDQRVQYPSTTDEDYMDVYYAIPEDGGYVMGDWAYRLTLGPRKGVRVEKA